MGHLYGRARRLTALFGGFGPGRNQILRLLTSEANSSDLVGVVEAQTLHLRISGVGEEAMETAAATTALAGEEATETVVAATAVAMEGAMVATEEGGATSEPPAITTARTMAARRSTRRGSTACSPSACRPRWCATTTPRTASAMNCAKWASRSTIRTRLGRLAGVVGTVAGTVAGVAGTS